ncbi:hypothetical protein [Alcanivorax sp. 24]|uniref:hypothetical protein n=1 Tax=Alcanivorax sp. 24 TaxID=2545266 RepID=UPI00105C060D|nr:hypothetical protein [Alcanivorax sp. 24]
MNTRGRSVIALLMLLLTAVSVAQPRIQVREWDTRERLYRGELGDMPLTLMLRVHEFSPGHRDIYSLSGAYRRGDSRAWVPLVGLRDTDGWALYRFDNPTPGRELLDFAYEGSRFWDSIAYYRALTGWTERFEINHEGTGSWRDEEGTAALRLYNPDLSVYRRYSFLHLQDGERERELDLTAFDMPAAGNEVLEWREDGQGLVVLLGYQHPSRPYALGMCGAGDESGLVRLRLDTQWRLLDWRTLTLDSCLKNQISERTVTRDGDYHYRVQDSDGRWHAWLLDQETLDWKPVDDDA